MSRPSLDFWFEFASTYSYVAAMRAGDAAARAGVQLRWRPFLLGPIFKAQGWDSSPFNLYPVKGRYMWRDIERLCAELNAPFRIPDPFPQNGLNAARAALAAIEQGFGEDFVKAVYLAEFGEGRQISDAAVIGEIITRLGHDAESVLERAQSDEIKARLRSNTEEGQARGLFGAPSFVTEDGELFWGNDRLDQALAWTQRRQEPQVRP